MRLRFLDPVWIDLVQPAQLQLGQFLFYCRSDTYAPPPAIAVVFTTALATGLAT